MTGTVASIARRCRRLATIRLPSDGGETLEAVRRPGFLELIHRHLKGVHNVQLSHFYKPPGDVVVVVVVIYNVVSIAIVRGVSNNMFIIPHSRTEMEFC